MHALKRNGRNIIVVVFMPFKESVRVNTYSVVNEEYELVKSDDYDKLRARNIYKNCINMNYVKINVPLELKV